MIRGTTPSYTFTFPFAVSTLSTLYISFGQAMDEIAISKSLTDCTVDGNSVTVSLTQSDTLALSADRPVFIQIRAKDTDGIAYASDMAKINLGDVIKEGVI